MEDSEIGSTNAKYTLEERSVEAREIFEITKKNKDRFGNNSCHYAFEIEDEEEMYTFIRLLTNYNIGDMFKRNQ